MANEHSNSAEQKPDAVQLPKEHAGSSKLMRLIVWGLVGVFALVALMDIASRQGFTKTLANLEEGIDNAEEPVSLTDFENGFKSGLAIKMTGSKDAQSTILYKWPSLFRKYEIHLTVIPGEDELLATYSTNDDPAALIGQPGVDDGSDDSLLEGGPGMPGMNAAPPGDAQGKGRPGGRRSRGQRPGKDPETSNPVGGEENKPAEENKGADNPE